MLKRRFIFLSLDSNFLSLDFRKLFLDNRFLFLCSEKINIQKQTLQNQMLEIVLPNGVVFKTITSYLSKICTFAA
jgi:hypothetical protein